MDPFIGQILLFAGNFPPRGFAFCDGQLLEIRQHTALISILGTTYGGDGQTTFALPDLRGRAPIHAGHGIGLSQRRQGERGGSDSVQLTVDQLPAHRHGVRAGGVGDVGAPEDQFIAAQPRGNATRFSSDSAVTMNPEMVEATGGGAPVPTRSPFLALRYCIALQGMYPSRS